MNANDSKHVDHDPNRPIFQVVKNNNKHDTTQPKINCKETDCIPVQTSKVSHSNDKSNEVTSSKTIADVVEVNNDSSKDQTTQTSVTITSPNPISHIHEGEEVSFGSEFVEATQLEN